MSAAPLEDVDHPEHNARVGSHREIQIPSDLLTEANLHVGDRVRVVFVSDGELRLVRDHHPLLDLAGFAPGLTAAADLEALRDEWER
jgi:antitoxin component of MazEF toxin-antitoxin module